MTILQNHWLFYKSSWTNGERLLCFLFFYPFNKGNWSSPLFSSCNPRSFHKPGKAPEVVPEVIDKIYDEVVKAYTEHTVTNPIKFKKKLDKVRRQGYAMSIEEITKNNYSIAVPVRDQSGKIACAITVVGPLSRVKKGKLEQFIKIMKDAALDASERLGYYEE